VNIWAIRINYLGKQTVNTVYCPEFKEVLGKVRNSAKGEKFSILEVTKGEK